MIESKHYLYFAMLQVLKTGQLVGVDADKGVVNILNSSVS